METKKEKYYSRSIIISFGHKPTDEDVKNAVNELYSDHSKLVADFLKSKDQIKEITLIKP